MTNGARRKKLRCMSNIDTQITRLLDAEDVPYKLLPHDEPVFTVETAAAQRGVIKEEMVKSILLRESKRRRYVMACVPGDERLDHRAVREHLPGSWKRFSFASAEEIEAVTGYQQGAVAPLCLPEDVAVIFDESIADLPKVNISSGDPLAGIELETDDLIRLTGAQLAPIREQPA